MFTLLWLDINRSTSFENELVFMFRKVPNWKIKLVPTSQVRVNRGGEIGGGQYGWLRTEGRDSYLDEILNLKLYRINI